MAQTVTPLGLAGVLKIIREASLNATPDINFADGSATLYMITVDNSAVAAVTYVKLYNSASPTVGTTDPDLILMLPSSTRKQFLFKTGDSFSTAISMAAVTTGGTGGTTNPTGSVICDVVTG